MEQKEPKKIGNLVTGELDLIRIGSRAHFDYVHFVHGRAHFLIEPPKPVDAGNDEANQAEDSEHSEHEPFSSEIKFSEGVRLGVATEALVLVADATLVPAA